MGGPDSVLKLPNLARPLGKSLHCKPSRMSNDRVLSMLQTEEQVQRPRGKEKAKKLRAKVD